jgi:hypothetical protein
LILSEKLQETLKAPCQMNIIKIKGILFVIMSVLSHCGILNHLEVCNIQDFQCFDSIILDQIGINVQILLMVVWQDGRICHKINQPMNV